MRQILKLAKQSIILDYKLFQVAPWNFIKKLVFIFKKYQTIIRHFFRPFKIGDDCINLFKETILYDSRFGLAGYQSILTRHQNLLKIAHVNHVTTVIDVGANVGFFSKLVREIFPNCRVYSFEPIPETYHCLRSNFINDGNVAVFKTAISDQTGTTTMTYDSQNSAVSRIDSNGSVVIQTITLDDFIIKQGISLIDILKIDTETFEAHVLRGAHDALVKTRYLFIEITIQNNSNYTFSSLVAQLYSPSYNFQLIGFRNYGDRSEGEMPIMDALFRNVLHPLNN